VIRDLLPTNSTTLERAICDVFTEELELLQPDIDKLKYIRSISQCDPIFLNALAWEYGVDVWLSSWSDEIKRNVILNMPRVHQLRGTIGAVQNQLDALNINAEIDPWYNYGGAPYHFNINISRVGAGLTSEEEKTVLEIIEVNKRAISRLDNILFGEPTPSEASEYIGVGVDIIIDKVVIID